MRGYVAHAADVQLSISARPHRPVAGILEPSAFAREGSGVPAVKSTLAHYDVQCSIMRDVVVEAYVFIRYIDDATVVQQACAITRTRNTAFLYARYW